IFGRLLTLSESRRLFRSIRRSDVIGFCRFEWAERKETDKPSVAKWFWVIVTHESIPPCALELGLLRKFKLTACAATAWQRTRWDVVQNQFFSAVLGGAGSPKKPSCRWCGLPNQCTAPPKTLMPVLPPLVPSRWAAIHCLGIPDLDGR